MSGSNDYATRFWTRNHPGDDMRDKYNVHSLPVAERSAAVMDLVEIGMCVWWRENDSQMWIFLVF